MLQAVLFDLDGTLLPMDNDHFTKVYFALLAEQAKAWGYHDSEKLIAAIWSGVKAMVKNEGPQKNCEVFLDEFAAIFGEESRKDMPKFDSFYAGAFHQAKAVTAPAPLAREVVRTAREKAERVILATNPLFPTVGVATRLSWIGLELKDFDWVTDYSNSASCKPNPDYYRSICEQFGLDPAECLMVGNDVDEDIQTAAMLGMPGFLLTDYIINRAGREVDCPQGSYEDLLNYLKNL